MIALLVSGFADVSQVEYTGLIGYAVIVLKEGITGLLIGLAANVCNSIILFAGNIIDMDIGLSMATEFDPINNAQVTLTGNLYNYFILNPPNVKPAFGAKSFLPARYPKRQSESISNSIE